MSEVRVLVLHGPNLNLLGRREPEVYGVTTLAQIDAELVARGAALGWRVECFQSNHEGALVDRLQAALDDETAGVLLNPAAYTHTSVAIRDAVAALGPAIPVVEVHLSHPDAREPFRHQSFVAGVVRARVSGFGAASYRVALEGLRSLIPPRPAPGP